MPKVIVTGGAGFIGSHLVDSLIDRGDEVHIIDNLSTGKRENINKDAIFHELDIRDLEGLKGVFGGVELIFHVAALARVQPSIQDPLTYNEHNVTGTLNVLVAARDAGVERFVYSASGGSVYGNKDKMPFTEDMTPDPISPYALQKLVGEHYTRLFSLLYGMKTSSLRYFNVFGSRMVAEGNPYNLVIGRFIELKKKGQPLTIVPPGTQTRDFTHVSDIVRANVLASESDKAVAGQVMNIGAGKPRSINEVAEIVGGPTIEIEPRIEPQKSYADNSLAKELIGWEPKVSLEEGIAELKEISGIE